jgi:hypothetical protein
MLPIDSLRASAGSNDRFLRLKLSNQFGNRLDGGLGH